MIKKIAWETFKNTGDINVFMELKQIEGIEKQIEGQKENSFQSFSAQEIDTNDTNKIIKGNVIGE